MQSLSQTNPLQDWTQRWFFPLLITGVLINISGLFLTILEPDGALYALIAKTIAQSGDFVNLKVEGKDWLDKPHFPFWMAAISYKIFGINSFAYKLPALLFWAMGAWYTWKLAHEFYGRTVAQLSVLIYLTAAHLVISNNDVRAEPYLTGLIVASVFHYHRAAGRRIGGDIVAGSLFAAGAVMTKGPFVLITIGAGFVINWILKKEWSQLFHPRWWLALLLVGIFILPELYCLYVQFDTQPQKLVFGRTGVSGLRFCFWDSQFG
ncbi:MAG: glycosyltransferase family 39 protein, partial [Bacteroidetes bacterium]|nr:glycosyltransferase family 39 protein [Bacteroidota bacterium]